MSISADARSVRSREAILDAARQLLVAHGPAAVTHQRVAEHSGLGRATVYRHWPRSEDLLLQAMASVPMPFFVGAERPYRDSIAEQVMAIARQFDDAGVLAVSTTLFSAALWAPEIDAYRDGFAAILTSRLAHLLSEAQRQGELDPAVEPTQAAALVLGPVVYRAIVEHAPADDALIRHTIAGLGTWA